MKISINYRLIKRFDFIYYIMSRVYLISSPTFNLFYFSQQQRNSRDRRSSVHGSVIRSRSISRAASWGASSSDDESKTIKLSIL